MKTLQIRHLGALVALAGIALIILAARKTVHIAIDGEKKSVTTYALTVGSLLRQVEIPVGQADYLDPPPNHWLRNGETITLDRAARIRIQDGEKVHTFLSVEKLPANLLAAVGIKLYPGDLLLYNGETVPASRRLDRSLGHSLQIRRAQRIKIQAGGQEQVIHSNATTLGQALWQAGVSAYLEDEIAPAIEAPILKPVRVYLLRSQELKIHTADTILKIRTTQPTVGLALAEAGIAVQGLDYSQPALDSALPRDGNIKIARVEEQVNLETEPLPFETEHQPVSNLQLDKQTVVQAGSQGIIARRLRIRLEDGKEIARQIEAEFIAQEPKPRILGYGTKIVPQTINISGATLNSWRAVNMYAVSYNPTSAGGTVTASGLPLQKGVAAVDPTYIPLGTRLFIPGYGEAIAADTGGGVNGRIIDLGYSDHDYEAWHQWVTVYFLWPPPENVAWVIP
jgi:uncharacterized protein YabE (DUF348 family)